MKSAKAVGCCFSTLSGPRPPRRIIWHLNATKNFKQETFNQTNRHKYNNGFMDYGKGLPVMFFVVHPSQKGKTNEKQIEQIEDFLIQAGFVKNPRLQNVRGAHRPKWSIQGVVRSGKGKRTKDEIAFRQLFDLVDE